MYSLNSDMSINSSESAGSRQVGWRPYDLASYAYEGAENGGFPKSLEDTSARFVHEVAGDPLIPDSVLLKTIQHVTSTETYARLGVDDDSKPADGKKHFVAGFKEFREYALKQMRRQSKRGWANLEQSVDNFLSSFQADRRSEMFDDRPKPSTLLFQALDKRLKARDAAAKAAYPRPTRMLMHAGAAYAKSQKNAPEGPITQQPVGRLRTLRNVARSHAKGIGLPLTLESRSVKRARGRAQRKTTTKQASSQRKRKRA